MKHLFSKSFTCTLLCASFLSSLAVAKEIKTNTATMQAMDKVTGRVKMIDVPVGGSVDFGSFSIVVRDCQTRPPEETPENFAFVDVVDSNIDGTKENIFRGWMMSSTPALNAIEHPIYDIWLLKCVDSTVDTTKLLTAEQLEERNSIAKRVAKNTKFIVQEGEPQDLIDEEVIEEGKEVQPETTTEESQPEQPTQIPEEQLIDGILEEELVVKGLTPDNVPAENSDESNASEKSIDDSLYDDLDDLLD
ncbi:MAG: DUF2155 domain-containing protein [Alphaproteobacteria bacterium]|nr:DUF2155 domain-containing protein [Alphaproteobacteria bacterium]